MDKFVPIQLKIGGCYDTLAESLATSIVNPDPQSRADQSFADDADINTIVRRFGIGQQPYAPPNMPTYEDYSEVTDYHSLMNLVRQAAEQFADLPADVRRRFDNDPGKMENFLGDEKNREEALAMGLIERRSENSLTPAPTPASAPSGAPAPAPAAAPVSPPAASAQ